jgi:Flp pilus assembly pilin Flp
VTPRRFSAGDANMKTISSIRNLLRRVHDDQRGAVSLETILIIGAIALPILIFIIKFGWPRIRQYFYSGMNTLEGETNRVTNGQ